MAKHDGHGQQERRERILEWLAEDRRVWFEAALHVQADYENPDSVALAAHETRELLEKLPRQPNEKPLKVLTNELLDAWQKMVAATATLRDGQWQGDVDDLLAGFLVELQGYFETFRRDWPGARDEARAYLAEQLPGSDESSPHRLDQRAREWVDLRRYMTQVAHHGSDTSEFAGRFQDTEHALLDVALGSLEKYRQIDQIVRDAEAEASSHGD